MSCVTFHVFTKTVSDAENVKEQLKKMRLSSVIPYPKPCIQTLTDEQVSSLYQPLIDSDIILMGAICMLPEVGNI